MPYLFYFCPQIIYFTLAICYAHKTWDELFEEDYLMTSVSLRTPFILFGIQTSGHTLALRECLAGNHGAACTASHRALRTDFPLGGATAGGRLGTESGNDARSSLNCFLGGVKRS